MKSTCHNSPVIHYINGDYCSVCFQPQHKTTKYTWVIYAALLVMLIMAINPVKAPNIHETIHTYRVYTECANDIKPSDSTLLVELVKNNCVLASVAVAQARIESANYTSDIAVNNKNLFGIKVHNCKYVKGKRSGHATFASFKDNVACYCEIQHRYLKKIHKAYAEDSLYCQKVKQMK